MTFYNNAVQNYLEISVEIKEKSRWLHVRMCLDDKTLSGPHRK